MPDDDLFQRLSLDQSLRRIVSIYWNNVGVFTKIVVVPLGVSALVKALVVFPMLEREYGENWPVIIFFNLSPGMGLSALMDWFLFTVTGVATIKATADLYCGVDPNFIASLKLGATKALIVMWTSFVAALGLGLGFILLFVPGLYFSVVWYVWTVPIVVENVGTLGSLSRSRELVSGDWCYVFCTSVILSFFGMLCVVLWTMLFVSGGPSVNFAVVGAVLSVFPYLVILPMGSIMQSVMYINLRVEKDGLNAQTLSREMGHSDATSEYIEVPMDDDDTPQAVEESGAVAEIVTSEAATSKEVPPENVISEQV